MQLAPPEMDSTIQFLLRNEPTGIDEPASAPSCRAEDYDAIIYVDASANGYGAFVALANGNIVEVRGGWHSVMHHSAHSERRAAKVVLDWIRSAHPEVMNIAVVTDHEPIARAQRRWHIKHGGFSCSSTVSLPTLRNPP